MDSSPPPKLIKNLPQRPSVVAAQSQGKESFSHQWNWDFSNPLFPGCLAEQEVSVQPHPECPELVPFGFESRYLTHNLN